MLVKSWLYLLHGFLFNNKKVMDDFLCYFSIIDILLLDFVFILISVKVLVILCFVVAISCFFLLNLYIVFIKF